MRTQNRRVSIRSSARTDPIRQGPRNLSLFTTYRTMPPSATRHASCNHGYKGTVLLEPRIRYWSIPLNTLHSTTVWSRWRAYLPAVLAVFYKLIICIDILLQVTLTSRGDNIRTILCTMIAFFPELLHFWLAATALVCSTQWCTYLIIHYPSRNFRFFVKDRCDVNLDINSGPTVVLSEALYFFCSLLRWP